MVTCYQLLGDDLIFMYSTWCWEIKRASPVWFWKFFCDFWRKGEVHRTVKSF